MDAILTNAGEVIDLANVHSGGRVVFVSDQHFGVGSNLLLPGRGAASINPYKIEYLCRQARTWEMDGRPSEAA